MKKTMYLIKYESGDYEDAYEYSIFVTDNIELAESYCKRFNGLLEKWKEILTEIVRNVNYDSDQWAYDRYSEIMQIKESYYIIIEVR